MPSATSVGNWSVGNWSQPCSFPPDSPRLVILFALGRSGSTSTWDVLSTLAGRRNAVREETGNNPQSSKEVMRELEESSVRANWTMQVLCHAVRREKSAGAAGIVGFQWKPFHAEWNHPCAVAGLKAVANSRDPIVKGVYLRRNPLDVMASDVRHRNSKNSEKKISDHCKVGDAECLGAHSKAAAGLNLSTGKDLLRRLKWSQNTVRGVRDRLSSLKIPYVEVAYEKLYGTDRYAGRDGESAEEWMRVFRHLGVGPQKGLTMETVRGAMSLAPTTKKSRNETIHNFKAVAQTLTGTEYEHYLVD